jgi:hypothetical protein
VPRAWRHEEPLGDQRFVKTNGRQPQQYTRKAQKYNPAVLVKTKWQKRVQACIWFEVFPKVVGVAGVGWQHHDMIVIDDILSMHAQVAD